MTPERAVELLSELRFDNVRLSVAELDASGRATVVLSIYQEGQLVMEKAQSVRLLPPDAVDEARFRAFVQGIGVALRRCDVESVMPCDLVVANLLRVPTLQTPEDFAACLEKRAVRRDAVADLEVMDYAREQGLAPPANPAVRMAAGAAAAERLARGAAPLRGAGACRHVRR